MSNKQNDIIREYIEENQITYKQIPHKYFDLPVIKWFKFIPKNLKINKEVTWEEVKDDAN